MVDLEDTPTHRGDLSVEQFRDNVRTLSLRRGTQQRSSRRQPLRERIRQQLVVDTMISYAVRMICYVGKLIDPTGIVISRGCSVVENIKI